MAETCRVIYDNKLKSLHQVGTSRHLHNNMLPVLLLLLLLLLLLFTFSSPFTLFMTLPS